MILLGRTRLTALAVAAVAALGLAGCGGDDGSTGADTTDAADPTGASGSGDTSQGAPAPGGGLTVSEALDSDLKEPLTVTGFLIDDGSGPRLCETILDSFPPQCGEPSLNVEGVTLADMEGAEREGDVAWVEQATFTGEVSDGVLQVSSTTT